MDGKIFALYVGMLIVTYFPRVTPLVVLSRLHIPPLVLKWLKYIPVAVLASLLGPELILRGGAPDVSLHNVFLLAAFPAFFVAAKSKNLFYTVFTGMICVVLFTKIGF